MKLNSIIYCFILWAFVEVVVIAIALFRLHKMRKLRTHCRQFHTRKSFFLKKGISGDELLQELFFSFASNKPVQRILFKAIKINNPDKAFEFLENEFPQNVGKLSTKKFVKAIIGVHVVELANLALHFRINNIYSQLIYIVVNTTGLIMLIIQEYECMTVDCKKRERKLAREFGQKNKTQIFQLVAGLGLILNISMIAAQFLEQAV
jgi:4-hydroxybenzoate polyprenyltransferase